MNRKELLKLYAVGERNFSGVNLHSVNLDGVILKGINQSRGTVFK